MNKIYLFCIGFLLLSSQASADKTVRIVSYNLENLFDCENDPKTDDDSFTPEGDHHWTYGKYWTKVNNLSRAITAAGEWETPIVIGLCEVENAKVVDDLLHKTQLKNAKYQFIHKDSPDRRGVDVALVYLPSEFRLLQTAFIPVNIIDGKPTRDILHATGQLSNGDTLHVFVNHWPSRYGGEMESRPNRMLAAETLREKTDSLFSIGNPKIIILGDFNDYPDDESLIYGLCAVSPSKNSIFDEPFDQLYNLAYPIHEEGKKGSHKFGGEWGMLDQIIVSATLLNEEESTFANPQGLTICEAPFLFKESATGPSPKRSFLGNFFAYGYSDHLPIYIDIYLTE